MAEASVDLKAVPAKSAGKKSVKKEEPKELVATEPVAKEEAHRKAETKGASKNKRYSASC